ncbi:hypothetical protein G7Y79_00014g036070 [Physcia stellaris]|nr:hypothetical protein G7Y79_00014g036070 [Physcia stellaris]
MVVSFFAKCYAFLLLLLLNTVACLPQFSQAIAQRSSSGPLVFAHYMLIEQPLNGNYTNDITLAKGAGIDAFAINYGGWNANFDQQSSYLSKFYTQAATLDFKVFLSFDLTSVTSSSMLVDLYNTYSKHSAQLLVDGKPMLSTFQTTDPAWNWQSDVLAHLDPKPLFIPGTLSADAAWAYNHSSAYADGVFPWLHTSLTTTQEHATDAAFAGNRTATGKKWIAPVAPWFFKRFSADMNWANKQDDGIWIHKWLHLLQLQPDFIEIVTWNDWGEASYIGPSNPAGADAKDNMGCYWSYYDHSAFLKMTKVFARAFKARQTAVQVQKGEEDVFMFYRTQPALTNGVDKTLPLPDYADSMHDAVFVVSFLNASATVTLDSGLNAPVSYVAGPGVGKKAILWSLGNQTLTATRKGDDGFRVNKMGVPVSGQFHDYNGNVVAV